MVFNHFVFHCTENTYDDVSVKCQNFLYSSLFFSNKYRTEGVHKKLIVFGADTGFGRLRHSGIKEGVAAGQVILYVQTLSETCLSDINF